MAFHNVAYTYFQDASEYIKKTFPLDDQLIYNSAWINLTNILKKAGGTSSIFMISAISLFTQ